MAETKFELRFEIETLEGAAYLLKAVVHPTRLAVIDLLVQNKEMSVSALSEVLEIS